MAGKKKTIITIETWHRIVLSKHRIKTLRCELCAAEVVMLSLAQAAKLSDTDEQTIIRRLREANCILLKQKKQAPDLQSFALNKKLRVMNKK